METNSKTLRAPPQNLEHLSNSIALLEDLQADLTNTEAKIPPLHDQFVILEKYEVEISEEVFIYHIILLFHLYCPPFIFIIDLSNFSNSTSDESVVQWYSMWNANSSARVQISASVMTT